MKKRTKPTLRNSIPAEKRIPNEVRNTLSELVPSSIWNIQQINNLETLYTNNRYSPLTIQRVVLNYLYMEHGLVQTLINQPIEDALRGGLDIISEELDSDDLSEWQKYLNEKNIFAVFKEAVAWSRLFGGSGLIINVHEDPRKPFNFDSIKKDDTLEFYPADRWELQAPNRTWDRFFFYNVTIDRSRVLIINGKMAPSIIRPQLAGWGMSEIEHVVRELNAYLKHNNVVFELLDEAKLDVWKILGFNNSLATNNGTELIRRRIQLANVVKNYQNAIVMDKEDEYAQKQLAFTGLAEMLREIRIGIATALRMPMTKLFGLSASGFNSGEDDLENYNAMIESNIRDRIRNPLNDLLGLTARVVFGYLPEFQFHFKPLRVMDDVQQETVATSFQNRMVQLHNAQLMTAPETIDALKTKKLVPIKLEAEALEDFPGLKRQDDIMDRQEPEDDKPPEGKAKNPKSGDDKNPKSGDNKEPASGKEKNK